MLASLPPVGVNVTFSTRDALEHWLSIGLSTELSIGPFKLSLKPVSLSRFPTKMTLVHGLDGSSKYSFNKCLQVLLTKHSFERIRLNLKNNWQFFSKVQSSQWKNADNSTGHYYWLLLLRIYLRFKHFSFTIQIEEHFMHERVAFIIQMWTIFTVIMCKWRVYFLYQYVICATFPR